MARIIPLPVLIQEGANALKGFPKDYFWVGEDGWRREFCLGVAGRSVEIRIKDGPNWSTDTNYFHVVEIFPREREAFFYKYMRHSKQGRTIEQALRERGYSIGEKDLKWFNSSYPDRRKLAA